MPKRFRTRPVEIEATQFTGDNWEEMAEWTGNQFTQSYQVGFADDETFLACVFDFLHGTWIGVLPGQWIVRGAKGEFYPCDDETFHWKYEEVV